MKAIQPRSLILPQYWRTGLEYEDCNNLLVHRSLEIYIPELHEKTVQIFAVENITAGVIGALWAWVELSPVPTSVSAAYWAAIGGGGGALAPVAPLIIAGSGVSGTSHSELLSWTMHSEYARVIVQMPVGANPTTAFWQVQLVFSGKGN